MKRYLYHQIQKDLKKKMVFITGPRQVGKTYLAKQIMEQFKSPQYLNFDDSDGRRMILNHNWKMNADLVVFDEIHKMEGWKNYIKGIFDTRQPGQSILVTGSARLDAFRKGGDSMAGRYFHLRLNPLSVRELADSMPPYETIEKFNNLGLFPEPFLTGDYNEASRWRNQYFTDLVREDIMDLGRIHELRTMKLLLETLRGKVGSLLSFNALAKDLQVSPTTIQKYVHILESLYIVFLIRPYQKLIYRSIKQAPKLYFYDTGFVKGDEGIKLENTCAVCLLKYVQYQYDVFGEKISLNYIRNKEKREIDFVIVKDDLPLTLIEVKLSESKPGRHLLYYADKLPKTQKIQLVHNLKNESDTKGIMIRRAGDWLSALPA